MSTVYEEAVRRLTLKINVIALRSLYAGLPGGVARTVLREFSIILRTLKLDYTYIVENNVEYRKILGKEFVLGTNPLDVDYDFAHEPSSVSHSEAIWLENEYAHLLLKAEQFQLG